MDEFNDRRERSHLPTEADYSRPVTKGSLTAANRRFRATGIPGAVPDSNREKAAALVARTIRERFNTRKNSGKEFSNIGEYLEYLNEAGKNGD